MSYDDYMPAYDDYSIPASEQILSTTPALKFANDVRGYLGQPSLNALPLPKEYYYSSSSCPLAIAFGAFDEARVTVTGHEFVTTSQELAEALTVVTGNPATYCYQQFTIKAPEVVSTFVRLFDEVFALEQQVKRQEQQLAAIAMKTGFAHDSVYDVAEPNSGPIFF